VIAALLVAAAFGAGHAEERSVRFAHWQPACARRGDRRCRRRAHRLRVVRPAPPSGSPVPTPTPGPTPGPTPPPLPSRTSVDLTEWRVTPAYRALRAGEVEFNAANLGEDDHDFSIRNAGGAVLANEVVLVGDSVTVRISLAPAVYTLYCSLPDHEANGMRADITVR
jgi:Copper binding proteins, plastocyanin/azurin family